MPLCSDILKDLLLSRRGDDLPFSGIVTTDSRKVEKNGIFAAGFLRSSSIPSPEAARKRQPYPASPTIMA